MDKDLLIRFFEGNATLQEEIQIRKWMEASPENYHSFFEERKWFDSMILLTDEANNYKKNIFSVFKNKWIKKITNVAAVIAISISISVCYQHFISKEYLLAVQKITVPAGQRISLELSDGTKVWLNSRTKIEYPAYFIGDSRKIKLDGEAYFEVTKDDHKPFVVETSKGCIEVLGTKFNVEAYSQDNTFTTALMEGSVMVKRDDKQYMLRPNQMVYLCNDKMNIAWIEDYGVYRWKEGLICFKDESFPNIIKKFEKYYGVEIKIENNKILNYSYTGKFRQSDGVYYALRVLQKDVNFEFKREEDNHIIYIK